jgi:hypothetical protein
MVQMANNIMKVRCPSPHALRTWKLTAVLVQKMDVTNLIVNKLQAHIINETMVLPNMDEWPMPYWPESYDPAGTRYDAPFQSKASFLTLPNSDDAEGQDGRPHLIYQRPEKADQPELKKRKSLLKAFSFIDISPDGTQPV